MGLCHASRNRCGGQLPRRSRDLRLARFDLYCLDATTGEKVWAFAIADQIRCFPTIVGDRVFVAGCDSKFHVVDVTDGKEIANVDIEAPTGNAPAVLGDMIYFGTMGEAVFGINLREARIVWRYRHASGGRNIARRRP